MIMGTFFRKKNEDEQNYDFRNDQRITNWVIREKNDHGRKYTN